MGRDLQPHGLPSGVKAALVRVEVAVTAGLPTFTKAGAPGYPLRYPLFRCHTGPNGPTRCRL